MREETKGIIKDLIIFYTILFLVKLVLHYVVLELWMKMGLIICVVTVLTIYWMKKTKRKPLSLSIITIFLIIYYIVMCLSADSSLYAIFIMIYTLIFVGLYEELLFRYCLYHRLSEVLKDHKWVVILLVSFLFSINHLPDLLIENWNGVFNTFTSLLSPLIGGLFFSTIYLISDDVVMIAVLHAIMDKHPTTLPFYPINYLTDIIGLVIIIIVGIGLLYKIFKKERLTILKY